MIRDYQRPIIREYEFPWSGIVIEYHGCYFDSYHPNQCRYNRIVDLDKNEKDIKRQTV